MEKIGTSFLGPNQGEIFPGSTPEPWKIFRGFSGFWKFSGVDRRKIFRGWNPAPKARRKFSGVEMLRRRRCDKFRGFKCCAEGPAIFFLGSASKKFSEVEAFDAKLSWHLRCEVYFSFSFSTQTAEVSLKRFFLRKPPSFFWRFFADPRSISKPPKIFRRTPEVFINPRRFFADPEVFLNPRRFFADPQSISEPLKIFRRLLKYF